MSIKTRLRRTPFETPRRRFTVAPLWSQWLTVLLRDYPKNPQAVNVRLVQPWDFQYDFHVSTPSACYHGVKVYDALPSKNGR